MDSEPDTGWTSEAQDIIDTETGRPRLLAERCQTCVLGGEASITPHLRPGRLRQLIGDIGDGHLVCHSSLSNVEPHAAICRGWYEQLGYTSNYVRVMERLGAFVEVMP